MHSTRTKSSAQDIASSVFYMPQLPFKNETILKIKNNPHPANYRSQALNVSSSKFSFQPNYSTSVSFGGVRSLDFTNKSTNFETSSQTTKDTSTGFVYRTRPPFSPTAETEFNEQIGGIINQYPIVPNYPYIAEIRDTYNNIPYVESVPPPTKSLEIENYEPEGISGGGKESTTAVPFYSEQFGQDQQTNSYPTTFPEIETLSQSPKFTPEDSAKAEPFHNPGPTINNSHLNYLSNVPRELANAVVNDKRWQVVGPGGDDGWSLLNEDGVLEWKIHHVDGKWKVTSSEQLAKLLAPQQVKYAANTEKPEFEDGYNEPIQQDKPKVWTLEDDYAKWRAVSAERGYPYDESLDEASLSNQDYDYDGQHYNNDYYDYGDYYSNEPSVPGLGSKENFRPIWGDGDYKMVQNNNPGKDYPQFAGNIEIANSKDDAIQAWKSLLAQQGYWKFSESGNRQQPYPPVKTKHLQNVMINSERRIPTQPPILKLESGNRQKTQFFENSQEFKTKTANDRLENHQVNEPNAALASVRYENDHNRQHDQKILKQNHETMSENISSQDGREQADETNKYYGAESENSFERQPEPRIRMRHKDHSKLDSLINKLESIQREAKGRAVLDLTVLLKQIKGRRNFTSVDIPDSRNTNLVNKQKINVDYPSAPEKQKQKDVNNPLSPTIRPDISHESLQKNLYGLNKRPLDTDSNLNSYNGNNQKQKYVNNPLLSAIRPDINQETLQQNLYGLNKSPLDTDSNLNSYYENYRLNSRVPIHRRHNFKEQRRNRGNDRQRPATKEQNRRTKESNEQNVSRYEKEKRQPPITTTESYSHEKYVSEEPPKNKQLQATYEVPENKMFHTQNFKHSQKSEKRYTSGQDNQERHNFEEPEKDRNLRERYKIPQNRRQYSENTKQSPKTDKSDSSSFGATFIDPRSEKQSEAKKTTRRQKPSRKRNRRPNHPAPIVLKGDTEVEDEESGSKRNRKIIVIDYAGSQKKKSSVDKKDLELIIRNVRHRRSELSEEIFNRRN